MREIINTIGAQMVLCGNNCRGIACDRNQGILPRCLILEDKNRTDSEGAIVCGLNPARTKNREQQYYINNGPTYKAEIEYWNAHLGKIPYYEKLRNLVNSLGVWGPILWTDTVKCEKAANLNTSFTHEAFPDTVRRCAANYLRHELDACPRNWIAIAVGRNAFSALSLLCPDRFLLGVPHCTGQFANAQFDRLFEDDHLQKLNDEILQRFRKKRHEEPNGALWLAPLQGAE